MRLLVNHLTRMSSGFICVAGIDLESGRHARPVLDTQLPEKLLKIHGGVFEMAAVVDLGKVAPTPNKPEVEDYKFEQGSARFENYYDGENFWRVLDEHARPHLVDIFGKELIKRGDRYCGTEANTGKASLGVLRPETRPTLELKTGFTGKKQVRIHLVDAAFNLDLSVTDIRFYGSDHVTPDEAIFAKAQKRLSEGEEILLGLGLTRAKALGSYPSTHWLQVNNLHFRTRPRWRLSST